MFANANTKSLLKDLKTTMKQLKTNSEEGQAYMKKPTMGKLE